MNHVLETLRKTSHKRQSGIGSRLLSMIPIGADL